MNKKILDEKMKNLGVDHYAFEKENGWKEVNIGFGFSSYKLNTLIGVYECVN